MANKMCRKNWVVLVAGSKGWENYQHQANVCCLYQIIKKSGIPDEQIVVMMYDDIAQNEHNPDKGVVVGAVTELGDVYSGDPKDYTGKDVTPENFLAILQGKDGGKKVIKSNPDKGFIVSAVRELVNVYPGVPKDYTGKDVTPENFLAILQGKHTGKKVIKSGVKDNIYIYMTGLGKEGTFEFPEKSLCSKDFIDAIKHTSEPEQFSKMVIFMTSSYSASMFGGLDDDGKVYALAACDTYVQSTPSDYDEKLKIYLSDKFSSVWLNFAYTADFNTTTFQKLVTDNQAASQGPCPHQFGNMAISHRHLGDFLNPKHQRAEEKTGAHEKE